MEMREGYNDRWEKIWAVRFGMGGWEPLMGAVTVRSGDFLLFGRHVRVRCSLGSVFCVCDS